jgi:predicted phosphate transport protein (TIGR00153 family)
LATFPTFSFGGREKSIIQGIELHLSVVKSCVITFEKLVGAVTAGDGSANALEDEVFRLERRADEIQMDLNRKISEGAFFGGIREDILNLIDKIDDIADSAKNASRMLMINSDGNQGSVEMLKSGHMRLFFGKLLAAVDSLESLVGALQIDKKALLSKVHVVREYEKAAEVEKDQLLRTLFKLPRTDPVAIIQLRDFLYVADDVADNSARASDVIAMLVAKGYG